MHQPALLFLFHTFVVRLMLQGGEGWERGMAQALQGAGRRSGERGPLTTFAIPITVPFASPITSIEPCSAFAIPLPCLSPPCHYEFSALTTHVPHIFRFQGQLRMHPPNLVFWVFINLL